MQFSDLHLTADEYLAILREAWEKSEFFDGWDRNWHPEDIHNNFEAVFDAVGHGLAAYTHLIGLKMREREYSPNKKTVDDMKKQAANSEPKTGTPPPVYTANDTTQVFGGTLPRGEWDNYVASPVPPRGSRRDVFGDNA